MLPIVHTFFSVFTFLQLTTPLTSVVFIVFYPLGLFLHLINCGGILDTYLLSFLAVDARTYDLSFPWWILVVYVGVSLVAIRYRLALYACLGFAFFSLFFIQ